MPTATSPPTPSRPPISPSPTNNNPPIPPSLLDILPPLQDLLSRLLIPSSSTTTTTGIATKPPLDPTASPHGASPTNISGSPPSAAPSLTNPNDALSSTAPLAIKDLAVAASGIKFRIAKAREWVAKGMIDGGGMSVGEQEVVIEGLKEEVRRLEGVVQGMGQAGREVLEELGRREGRGNG